MGAGERERAITAIVMRAVRRYALTSSVEAVKTWAAKWISGEDRSTAAAARAAGWVAEAEAAARAAAWAAAEAEEAAAWAAARAAGWAARAAGAARTREQKRQIADILASITK
jgi:hypothetical protein